jgi:hexosaminidase
MQDKNLKDLKAVEQYFIQRMADTLFKMNNKVLLWDEAAGSALPGEKTIVFWWRHDRPEQLKLAFDKGFSAVLCPRLPFYLDFVQDSTQRVGRRWKGGLFNALDKVYNYSTDSLPSPKDPKQILGVQGALWTERIATDQKLEYMLFPRICALAENAWTDDKNRNFEEFSTRIKSHLAVFQQEQIYFYNPEKPKQNPEPLLPGDTAN